MTGAIGWGLRGAITATGTVARERRPNGRICSTSPSCTRTRDTPATYPAPACWCATTPTPPPRGASSRTRPAIRWPDRRRSPEGDRVQLQAPVREPHELRLSAFLRSASRTGRRPYRSSSHGHGRDQGPGPDRPVRPPEDESIPVASRQLRRLQHRGGRLEPRRRLFAKQHARAGARAVRHLQHRRRDGGTPDRP